MTLAKLDKRVGDLGARADELAERMEGVAGRYLEAVAPWVAGRFEADASAVVVAHPETAQELGGEGLSLLRAGLRELCAGAPDLVRRRLDSSGAWPHRWGRDRAKVVTGLYGTEAETVPPSFLESRLRLLLGTSGRLLARHGFERQVRRIYDRAYLRSDYHPPEYLARSLEGHEEFHPLLAGYGTLCDEYAGVLGELQRAGRDRAGRAAQDLWARA
ncbi:MAG: hypothetical protein FJW79_07475 [Actinobacteria bacterium]|nr:hypothetical protein [Actinomycetota bacterium]